MSVQLNEHYIFFALIAVVVVSLYMAVIALVRKDPVRERIKRVLPETGVIQGTGFSYEENRSPFFLFCSNLLTAFGVDLAKMRRTLYLPMARAGIYSPDAVVYFLFFKRFIQPIFVLAALLTFVRIPFLIDAGLTTKILYTLVGGILLTIGVDGARIFINSRTDRRKTVLQHSFPEALDLMLICVEAGLTLDAALSRVCRELKKTHPEITDELDRTRVEINVLNDRLLALQNLADRTDVHGFKTLVSALIQTEKIGSSMAETLRMLANEYRTARMLYAEAKAARIPTLITVPLIFFIMPAFMLIIMGPLMIRINQQGGIFPPGHSVHR